MAPAPFPLTTACAKPSPAKTRPVTERSIAKMRGTPGVRCRLDEALPRPGAAFGKSAESDFWIRFNLFIIIRIPN
ncbi:hypothetical protein BG58_00080 [Caballeronia jiangsuensis]|nr:hypothetical protein BG58_00080 [Caballeronia jiangsuensis]